MCDDRIRVQWFADTKLVDSRNSELVLITLDEVGGIVRTGFAFGGDQGPRDPGCLSLLHHIVGDGCTAVVLRRVPPDGALLSCDAGETDGTLNRSRGICRETEDRGVTSKMVRNCDNVNYLHEL